MSHAARPNTPLPPPQPPDDLRLRTNVHGTVFAGRTSVVTRLAAGDRLLLVPDPPAPDEPPAVWVHVAGGDVLGHVPVHVAAWLAPWMLAGGRCAARVHAVRGEDVASWSRIEIELERTVPTP
jgi:hypothetical protein